VHAGDSNLVCSHRSGALVARTGVPLADVYLEFLGGRCRPNTVRAAAYDLKVFFEVVARPADQVRPADVLLALARSMDFFGDSSIILSRLYFLVPHPFVRRSQAWVFSSPVLSSCLSAFLTQVGII